MRRIKGFYRAKGRKILKYANILLRSLKSNRKMEEEKVIENLFKAHREWKEEEKYFQSKHERSHDDLVDYTDSGSKVSEMEYNYLLKKLRDHNYLDK